MSKHGEMETPTINIDSDRSSKRLSMQVELKITDVKLWDNMMDIIKEMMHDNRINAEVRKEYSERFSEVKA